MFSNAGGGPAFSNTAVLTMEMKSDGGDIVGDATVCSGSNSGTLTVVNEVGNVLRWESSVSPFTSWSNISNTTLTHNYNNLAATTKFRAIVKNGVCANDTSTLATITTLTALAQYSITGSSNYCAGGSGIVLGLSGSESGVDYQLNISEIVVTDEGGQETVNAILEDL